MSRHRNVRAIIDDIDDGDDDDDDHDYHGRSVEDDIPQFSPTIAQFVLPRTSSGSSSIRHNISVSDFIRDGTEEPEQLPNAAEDNRASGGQPMFSIDDDDEDLVATPVAPTTPQRGNVVVSVGGAPYINGVASGTQSPSPEASFTRMSMAERFREERASSRSPSRPYTPNKGLPPTSSSNRLFNLAASATPKRKQRVRPSGGKDLISLVVIGHVDAGKSTLMGHLLYLLGNVNQKLMHKYKQESQKAGKSSFAFAWVLDESSEERARGVTMDIAKTQFETQNKQVLLLDAPGHRDFIPNMISGAAQADAALMVVNATTGEFETGFELGGQTREHAMLVRSLGVSQLAVAVNKLDTVDWSKERYEEIKNRMVQFLQKQAGFTGVRFVPVCGISGENLKVRPGADHPLCAWYDGPTLLQVLDSFEAPLRSDEKPLRITVSDVYKGVTSGLTIAGRVETGVVEAGDKVLIVPNGDLAQVRTVQSDQGLEAGLCFAGDQCLLSLSGTTLDSSVIGAGHVICQISAPVYPTQSFRARIMLFDMDVPITRGFPVALHANSLCEPALVTKLISQLHKGTGQVLKKKPRCLTKNTMGLIEMSTERPVCIEAHTDCKELGRVTLRSGGKTIGAGLVERILDKPSAP